MPLASGGGSGIVGKPIFKDASGRSDAYMKSVSSSVSHTFRSKYAVDETNSPTPVVQCRTRLYRCQLSRPPSGMLKNRPCTKLFGVTGGMITGGKNGNCEPGA